MSAQAQAVHALRANDKGAAEQSETQALGHLQEALRLLNEEQQDQQEEQQRQERAALKQAYAELAERQQALHDAVAPHARDEVYSRRDWRQVNALHDEALEGASFDVAQEAIRVEAEALAELAGDAMVYLSMHRRIDQAAGRAHTRLRDRRADALVLAEQLRVAALLRAMSEALDDRGKPDKFEREQQEQEQPPGGGGEGGEPPLVPDLAQVKLLREVQIDLRRQTAILDELGDQLTPAERAQRLQELAAQQRELGVLGEQLIEKLRELMQGDPLEPPSPEDRQ